MTGGLVIRAMTADDLADVVKLDKECSPTWSPEQFVRGLTNQVSWQLVALQPENGQFAGFICGRTVLDEGEIFKVAVAPSFRRRGVGTQLIGSAFALIRQRGAKTCFLEFRASNTPAKKLYARSHFKQIAQRKNYYTAPVEDAVIMQATL